MAVGLDYAFFPHPSITAIRAYGASFVCRYVSADARNDANGKNLLPAEKTALLNAGFSIVIVDEQWAANRMLEGKAAGIADATHADAVVKALGMPGVPVYFACDFDAAQVQQTAINAYLDGAASVIGKARTGIYAGYWPLKRAFDAGKVTWGWQTAAWSGGFWDARAQLRQVKNGITVGGASCDRDETSAADFGQWPRYKPPPPPPPPPPPQEEHMTIPGVPGTWASQPDFVVDAKGTVHVTGLGTDLMLYHASKPSGGAWSKPVKLA